MPSVQMKFSLKCLIRYDEEAEVYVSHCPALALYSQGENSDEAIDAIKSAVTLYTLTAYEHDRLDQALRRAGFTPQEQPSMGTEPEEFIAFQSQKEQVVDVEVPLLLLAAKTTTEQVECQR